jgi:FtsH-binding integral membrane protein
MVHLHLMASHIPVIGVLLLIPLFLIALVRRSDELSKVGLWGVAGIALAALVVYFTGEPTEEGVERLAGISEAMVERHEEIALISTIALGVFGLLALGTLFRMRGRPLSRGIVVSALVGLIVVSGAFAWTANLGGKIRHSEITSAVASAPSEDDDD